MTRKPVLSQEAPQPSGGYSQGIVAGGFLFLSGQGPYDASGKRVGTTIAEQVRQVLENLDAVARAAGGSLRERGSLRHVHQRHGALRRDGRRVPAVLPDPMPARTTIQSDLVGFDVEGDAVVWLGD